LLVSTIFPLFTRQVYSIFALLALGCAFAMLYACGECIYLSCCFDHCKRRRSFYQGHLSWCVRPASYSNAATTTMSNHHQQQQQGTLPAATGHTGGYPSPYNPPQQCAIQLPFLYPGISPLQSSMPPPGAAAAAAGGGGGVAGYTSTTTGRGVPGGGVAA